MLNRYVMSALVACTGLTFGASGAVAGDVSWRSCWAGTSQTVVRGEGDLSFSTVFFGTTVTDDPADKLHMSSFKCVSAGDIHGGKAVSTGYCQSVDADGDKFFSTYEVVDGAGPLTFTGGTGKFDKGSGVVQIKTIGQFPGIESGKFQGCNNGKGSYTLR